MDVYPKEIRRLRRNIPLQNEEKMYVEQEEQIIQNNESDCLSREEEDTNDENDAEEEVIEYVEEFSYGQVVHGEDNQYYVVMDEDTPEFDFEKLNNVRVVLNDDGTKTLLMENTTQKETLLNDFAIPANFIDDSYLGPPRLKRSKTDGGHVQFDGEHDTFGNDMISARTLLQATGKRNSRVYGDFKCPECDQAFVNTARLERHLAVHQVFGSFLCPLCGKTYKYEYNLFYHWRRTCRDMNELLSQNDRKNMEVTNLRQLVEEIAQKKANIGPLELGVSAGSTSHMYQHTVNEVATNSQELQHSTIFGRRSGVCKECGITTLEAHLPCHYGVHRGEVPVGEPSVGGGFFCDLCGLMFRLRFNLVKHWRSNCVELSNNLPPDFDEEMDNNALMRMVNDLVQKTGYKNFEHDSEMGVLSAVDNIEGRSSMAKGDETYDESLGDEAMANISKEQVDHPHHRTEGLPSESVASQQLNNDDVTAPIAHTSIAVDVSERDAEEEFAGQRQEMDEKWMSEQGIIFVDDLLDDEDMLMINEEGQLCSVIDARNGIVTSGAIGSGGNLSTGGSTREFVAPDSIPSGIHAANLAPDVSMYTAIHPVDAEERYISRGTTQAVQCGECFRSFANIARLERHLAGAHASYGTHHCQLCGSRFKYEYNLLYHIRRACPYAKAMIEEEAREQLPAANLKKLVRTLARQDVVRLPADQLSAMTFNHKPDLGDASIRQQMMRSVMPHYRAVVTTNSATGTEQPAILAPPPTYQSQVPRPGFPEGKKCPVCYIIFYGVHILARHMKVAHPAEYEVWAPHLEIENEEDEYNIRYQRQARDNYDNSADYYQELQPQTRFKRMPMTRLSSLSAFGDNQREQFVNDNEREMGDAGSARQSDEEEDEKAQQRRITSAQQQENVRHILPTPAKAKSVSANTAAMSSAHLSRQQHLRNSRPHSSAQIVMRNTEFVDEDDAGVEYATGGRGVGRDLAEIDPPPTLQPEPDVDDLQSLKQDEHYAGNYSRVPVDELGTMVDYRHGESQGRRNVAHYDDYDSFERAQPSPYTTSTSLSQQQHSHNQISVASTSRHFHQQRRFSHHRQQNYQRDHNQNDHHHYRQHNVGNENELMFEEVIAGEDRFAVDDEPSLASDIFADADETAFASATEQREHRNIEQIGQSSDLQMNNPMKRVTKNN